MIELKANATTTYLNSCIKQLYIIHEIHIMTTKSWDTFTLPLSQNSEHHFASGSALRFIPQARLCLSNKFDFKRLTLFFKSPFLYTSEIDWIVFG